MRLLISFAALLLSITLLQLSSGAIGPLDALSGIQEGFSTTMIGLLGSAHFLGFFIGCWWAPRLVGTVGHSRTFAVFASMGAIGALAHPIYIDGWFWAGLRILSGMCIAGCYTVIEAWFQSKVTNETRGRVLGAYRVVDIGASALAQTMIAFLEPAAYVSYNIIAILACACILPLTLTTAQQPAVPKAPRLHPIRTAITSPLGAAGVIIAGVTSSSFRMVSPVYGAEVGLSASQIGGFLATVLIGGAAAQFPVGMLADKYDRRWVLIGLSIASIIVSFLLGAVSSGSVTMLYAFAFLFGMSTFPIFSVSAAHANDFADVDARVELNASLMFLYGVGAIFSPLVTSSLIQAYGAGALFYFLSAAHVIMVVFSASRMLVRPSSTSRTRYRYLPRTTFGISKLIKRKKLD